ncbi:ATP-dependent DNA helicase [Methanosphaera sp. ISO3-F5]|uniref:ATP-dependent DNA helicase n=1 Tax=Methanosphaera sp. ISO3-F5 TaxID=1452353 RepID=UPI002B25FFAA|nr:ATP-dependent DNA helicase [Methanosphaera sp. ISO3-F5]WQH63672.1 ATP-dependent DNA helicase [Methanosphaera sp. ISO3-F5]
MAQKPDIKQETAIHYPLEPVLIEAGPGAGKTYVLINRIKYLLETKKVNPESLLIITFTIKAADELKKRLSSKEYNIPSEALSKMFIGTIHSFCNYLLTEYSDKEIYLLENDDVDERKVMFLQKNMDKLGLKGYSYVEKWETSNIIKKYDQFTNFGLKDEELAEYLEKNFEVSKDYKNFVNDYMEKYHTFPKDSVKDNDEYYNSWYFAKFIAIVKSYKGYEKLLKENNLSDFSFLQVYAKELLSKDEEYMAKLLPFKNILIDEFQDIDPIQKDIFEILRKYSDSFTVVGDDDQAIYGFRGSYSDNFEDFAKKNNTIELDINHRSGKNIVDFNECFIKKYRRTDKNLVPEKTFDSNVYYMKSDKDAENINSEAENISLLIKSLKDNNKIKNYSDVGILFRGIQGNGSLKKPIIDLLNKFDEHAIPYNMPDISSLTDQKEVKVMMTLLWYMKKSSSRTYFSKIEREWLNLRIFTELKDCLKLSDETCTILSEIEDKFEENVIEAEYNHENRLYKRGKPKNLKAMYTRYHNEKCTALYNEILNSVPHFELNEKTRTDLKDIGITDEHDLDFFEKLYNYRKNYYETSEDKQDSLLDVYYKLLEISGLLKGRFDEENTVNDRILNNLAIFTQTIFNYTELVDENDLNGLIWFILSNYENYSSYNEKTGMEDEVQLLTVHKAKGLEFPVVILCTLENNNFPYKEITKESIDELSKKERGVPTYPIKPEFFKNKHYNQEEEIELEDLEEKRIFYVACTRAEQLLILSTVYDKEGNKPEFLEELEKDTTLSEISPHDFNKIDKLTTSKDEEKTERIRMSYTSFSAYNKCPRMYNIGYNYQFRLPASKVINDGLAAHTILERMNKETLQGKDIQKEDITRISEKILQNYPDIQEENFNNVIKGIENYWKNYENSEWEIIGSEVPFNIIKEHYDIEGKIDLILKNSKTNDIKIVDYKTTNQQKLKARKKTHEQQLCIYAKALENYLEYNQHNIKYASVYSIYDNYELEIELTKEKIEKINNSLDKTVEHILNKQYDKTNKEKCDECPYYNKLCKHN